MSGYDAGRVIGISAGAAIGVLLVIAILKFSKKDGSLKCKYDERQELVRGKGFKYGFFTIVIYDACNMFYGNFLERIVMREVIMALGIFLGVVVYAGYAIWNDGYFSLNENPRRVMGSFVVLSVGNIFLGLMHIPMGDFSVGGVIGYPAVNLMVGIMILCLFGILLAKRICKKEPAEGQEEE